MLKNYVQQDPQPWDKFLPAICSAYNASSHEETGVSPHLLLTVRDFRLQADLMTGKPSFVPSPKLLLIYKKECVWCVSGQNKIGKKKESDKRTL